jgi:hypothetical protein
MTHLTTQFQFGPSLREIIQRQTELKIDWLSSVESKIGPGEESCLGIVPP